MTLEALMRHNKGLNMIPSRFEMAGVNHFAMLFYTRTYEPVELMEPTNEDRNGMCEGHLGLALYML